jgi:large subunit ribosomal protein L20
MTRVKRGTLATKKRKQILKKTKGFKWGRKSKERAAKEALLHSLSRKFKGRKEKKRTTRSAWQVKINAAVREHEMVYGKFIAGLKKKNIILDRKVLAEIAEHEAKSFAKIIAAVKEN